jgi:8-oxo-dGTP pyrophosphatase MutT (NUDIX family)
MSIDPAALTPIELTDGLRTSVADRLSAHDRIELPLDGRRHAAVAIVVVDSTAGSDRTDPHPFDDADMRVIPGYEPGVDDSLHGRMVDVSGGASFVLCRRSSRLNKHAGQWALPGGRLDAGESPVDAALRETHEEVGVLFDESHVLGLLDDYATRSGYVMTPVVVWGGADVTLAPSPDEVLAAYRVGLHQLARPDSPRFVDIPESDRPVVQVPLGGDLIHAPTGAVLVQFRWLCIDGRPSIDSRVADFEQPVFAWG